MTTPTLFIPAATAAQRDGLDFVVTATRDDRGDRMLLEHGDGCAVLLLGPAEGTFLVTCGPASLVPIEGARGRVFVEVIARWLGLEMRDEKASVFTDSCPGFKAWWARLGRGSDLFGFVWETFKLFLRLGNQYAEVFLRLSEDGTRAQLVEKWSAYREQLVAILESVLSDAPPRRVGPRTEKIQGLKGERLLSIGRAVEIVVPSGWRTGREPEGHWRLEDADGEICFEVSCWHLPPLAPGAPDVRARLRAVMNDREYRIDASPVRAFVRDEAEFAWSEYRYDATDTKRPDAPPRAARGRWLLGANLWTQVFLTGAWWETDVPTAESAWNDVVASLRLVERSTPPLPGAKA